MINLTPYSSIKTALLVRIVVKKYKESSGATATENIIKFSDINTDLTVTINSNQETYKGTGQIIDLSSSVSEIRSSSNEVTISISGVPNSEIAALLNSSFKGSKISIYRVILDPVTHQFLDITGNPMGRFFGMISNFSIDESWNQDTSTNTISFVCKSVIDILASSVTGRRTNSYDQQLYFPTDICFDRVPSLKGSNYNFGNVT